MVYDDQTIITEFSPDRDIYEYYEIFEQFLLAMGFAPGSIEIAGRCYNCNDWIKEKSNE